MAKKKTLFAINGSASQNSSNERLIDVFISMVKDDFEVVVFNDLKTLPHFDPQLSSTTPPASILDFRNSIERADGILICTPEYVFSIPSGLKNALEWCVATTILSDKPTALITASANGVKGHEELKLIMRTLMAKFTDDTTLLIAGIKGKVNERGEITDAKTREDLAKLVDHFKKLFL